MGHQEVENWDDDLEFDGPVLTKAGQAGHKSLSISSRRSIRSESNLAEEDWQIPLKINDDDSTAQAISSAKEAGIPIPSNVPASALLGGTIKRLGKKKSRHQLESDWDNDLDFSQKPSEPLKLKTPRMASHTANDGTEDFEDWDDGSLGIRFGGTRRESRNRSSSTSVISPSMGSINSEEDGLGGLIIPSGPLDLGAALKKRQDSEPLQGHPQAQHATAKPVPRTPQDQTTKEDFFADIDFGAGDVFDPKRNSLHRNVKPSWKSAKDASPAPPKTLTNLKFTDNALSTKIPRPVSATKPSRLEPVFESGPSTLVRSPRYQPPTTTGAQLLRSKRSMPALRTQHPSLSRQPQLQNALAGSGQNAFSRFGPRVSPSSGRQGSESRPHSPHARPSSRLSATMAPDTPSRQRRDLAPAALAREATAKRAVTRPTRRRNYGDGTELDTFDDLPTSVTKESKYVKQPSSRLPPKSLRNITSQSKLAGRERVTTPLPLPFPPTPKSPAKADSLPRFARDTAASRIAREQKLGVPSNSRSRENMMMPRVNWAAQVVARTPPHTSPTANRTRKGPQLVNPMGKENIRHFQDDAAKKGMHWNATLCRWEGNENVLYAFEPIASPSPPRPALITNISGAQGVQVVGGMVFDPQRMCWLKLGAADALSPSVDDDNDDPFGGIEDLQDTKPSVDANLALGPSGTALAGDWLVGEEFDLGPEFIRRQRDEEAAWRARVAAWQPEGELFFGEAHLWAIRDIAATATL